MSGSKVSLDSVQKYSLEQIEKTGILPDLVVHLEETFPFRSSKIIDEMIIKLLQGGYDTVIAAKSEAGSLWHEHQNKNIKRVDKGDIPRQFKEKSLIGLKGLCCVTHPEFIRNNKLIGKKIGLYKVKDQLSAIEVRTEKDKKIVEKTIKKIII